ncbi:hypothetical protein PBNK5_30120 [Pectobacterium brasiliense]
MVYGGGLREKAFGRSETAAWAFDRQKKSQHPSWLNNTGSNVSNVVPSQGSRIVMNTIGN